MTKRRYVIRSIVPNTLREMVEGQRTAAPLPPVCDGMIRTADEALAEVDEWLRRKVALNHGGGR